MIELLDVMDTISFTDEEIKSLEELKGTHGWKIFIMKIVKPKFNMEYSKLRNCAKTEKTYNNINGYLDALEFVANSLESVVQENKDE